MVSTWLAPEAELLDELPLEADVEEVLLAPDPHAASSNADSALPTNKCEGLNFIRFLLTFQLVVLVPPSGLLNELAPETSNQLARVLTPKTSPCPSFR